MLIEDLFPEVALRVPTVPIQLMESAARRALARFCRESTVWRERFTGLRLVADRAEYDLRELSDNPVCAITDVRLSSSQVPILPTNEQYLASAKPDWMAHRAREPRNYVAPNGPAQLRLYPVPNESGLTLDVQLAFFPGVSTSAIPDWIGEMYLDDLVDGTCGALYALPGKEWSSRAEAELAEQRLLDAARSARARVEKSNTRGIVTLVTTSFDAL